MIVHTRKQLIISLSINPSNILPSPCLVEYKQGLS
ncbi:unnamed protein product [Brassica oleracea var. botrytis]